MLVVETIARIRRDHLVKGVPIKKIARDLRVSKNTVRKVVRGDETSFSYARKIQPMPKLGPWVEELERQLEANAKKERKDRLSLLRIHEDLASQGYEGGYDAVRRYARAWRRRRRLLSPSQAFVPLIFDPGEAYQFDWSHEYAVLSGTTTRVKAAHMRLCHSRMQLVQIFPRESQEMVFEAHERAFRFFGGVCRRGIYDNMKTAVSTVFVGKKRDYNRRFQEMCSHHLVEPVACTPGAGWEKGQVERQVGDVRGRLFVPSPRGCSYAEINEWLMDRCIEDARTHPHPTIPGKTAWQVFEEEQPFLMAYRGPFDGFHATEVAVSKTCLVRFDNNQYSVAARAVGRPVDVRAYADRIVIRQDGEIVAEHPRGFGRGRFVYDPWHYVPVLTKKPGALRNGAPFKGWQLPNALGRLRTRLSAHDDGDRQFVKVLAAVEPNVSRRPMTGPRSARSAALFVGGTCGLSTKTHNPSRCLRSERSGLALRALRRVEGRCLAFETGIVMLQPRLVQPEDVRDPLDPTPAPSGEPHMAGRTLDEVAPLVAPAPAQDDLAGELAGQLPVGAVAVADHEHDANGVAE